MVSGYKYLVQWTAQYKRDVKRAKRRHYDIAELEAVIKKLANAKPLKVSGRPELIRSHHCFFNIRLLNIHD